MSINWLKILLISIIRGVIIATLTFIIAGLAGFTIKDWETWIILLILNLIMTLINGSKR